MIRKLDAAVPKVVQPKLTPKAEVAQRPIVAPRAEPELPPNNSVTGESSASRAEHREQAGAKAKIDLRDWEPAAMTAALELDIDNAFELLKKLPPAVTFFGGARIKEDDPYYEKAKEIGRWLAVLGVPVRTGAGPGVMAAAAEGFKEMQDNFSVDPEVKAQVEALRAQLKSVDGIPRDVDQSDIRTQGFNIALPYEQAVPEAIERYQQIASFPVRKVALYENARGLVTFPGGYGTLDELFEVWKLAARGDHKDPMLAFGTEFWQPMLDAVKTAATSRGLITPEQLAMMKASDDTVEIVEHIAKAEGVSGFEGDPKAIAETLKAEFAETVELLDKLEPAITFIGGERLMASDPSCDVARFISKRATAGGEPVRVGGDAAIADAVVRGAQDATPGAKIDAFLINGSAPKPGRSDLNVRASVDSYVTHKELIARRADAFVALPGGLGTLDEVFTVLCQVQCKKLKDVPIVLVGKDYWEPIMSAVKSQMLNGTRQTISPEDLDLFIITDDKDLAAQVALGEVSLTAAKADPRSAGITADD